MRKVCLIIDSSIELSPYVYTYMDIFASDQLTIIEWNRLKLEKKNREDSQFFSYKDNTRSHKKNYMQYLSYANYVNQKIDNKKFDLFVVFGIQISFFMRKFLKGRKYIIDIRDYHFLSKLPTTKKVIKNSTAIVISSEGYKKFIPDHNNILVNHNYNKNILNQFNNKPLSAKKNSQIIIVSAIGANRDLKDNMKLIKNTKNSKKLRLDFHGESMINDYLQEYAKKNKFTNVNVHGFYEKNYEPNLYIEADLINSFRDNKIFNNSVALPNKLYTAAYWNKPILTNKGSYLAEVIEKYNLGLVVNSYENIEKKIINYYINLDKEKYLNGVKQFFDKVDRDNDMFLSMVMKSID